MIFGGEIKRKRFNYCTHFLHRYFCYYLYSTNRGHHLTQSLVMKGLGHSHSKKQLSSSLPLLPSYYPNNKEWHENTLLQRTELERERGAGDFYACPSNLKSSFSQLVDHFQPTWKTSHKYSTSL